MVKKRAWRYFPHYSTVRDVMRDPARFQVPAEALRRRAQKGDIVDE